MLIALFPVIVLLVLAVVFALIEQKNSHTGASKVPCYLYWGLAVLIVITVLGVLNGHIGIWVK